MCDINVRERLGNEIMRIGKIRSEFLTGELNIIGNMELSKQKVIILVVCYNRSSWEKVICVKLLTGLREKTIVIHLCLFLIT